jgi:hypothetical protein
VARFKNDEDVLRWLAPKPREVATVFAARAALRAVPLLADRAVDARLSRLRTVARQQVLRAFRGVAVSWAKAAYPGDRAIRAAAATPISDSKLGLPSQLAAEYAAAASAHDETDGAAREFATLAVTHAIHACVSANARSIKAVLEAYAADADVLDRGISPVAVANSQLWPGPSNTWPLDEWTQLRPVLLTADEDWDVWTDWYEGRLMGRTANQALEVKRATIPNELWQRGPRVVNAEIKRLIEDPEIFAEVMGEHDLERRLTALSLEELRIIGARAALRALPLMSFGSVAEPTFSAALLSMLRVTSLAWAASAYPTKTLNRVVLNAARIDAINTRVGLVRAAAAATAAYSANQFEKILEEVTLGIDALRTASAQSDGAAAGAAFELALSRDLEDLGGAPGSAEALAGVELWPGGAQPEWLARRWDALKRELIRVGLGWEVWVRWYEDRLAGGARSEAHELAYVEVPDQLWKPGIFSDPAVVNTWIMERFDRPADQAVGDPPTGDIDGKAPPTVPAQRPAAIEPVWSNGRLTLPKAAAKSDLKGRKFNAALKSLREEMRAFADDITGEANIDKRFLSYVSTLAGQVPEKAPSQSELFRLGHAGGVFAGYAKTVNDEWPPILAARFHALTMHFDDTMRQSPLWREFKRNTSQERLTAEQVEAAASLAATVATALRDDDATAFIDPAIPGALERLAEPLHATEDASRNIIEAGQDELAFDVVESTSNILKRISEEALAFKTGAGAVARDAGSTLRDASGEYARGIGKGIKRAAKREGPKDGEKLFKWLRRAVLVAGGYGVSSALGVPQLIAAYPQAFAWLERLVGFIH